MSPQTISTGDEPEVLIEAVYGDLQVEGWERTEILLQYDNEDAAALKQEGSAVKIKSTGDCLLNVPYKARLTIANVHGGAHIKKVAGSLSTRRVLGSLAFEDVGEAQVGSVYGEFLAKGVSGNLAVDQVLGNAWVENLNGSFSLDRVAGDLDLLNVEGDVRASARGDARVDISSLTGASYKVEASGDITFNAPQSLDASVQISSRGNEIYLSLPDGDRRLTARSHELNLGAGTALISLAASGSVSLRCGVGAAPAGQEASQPSDKPADEFSQNIRGEVESQLDAQMKILDEQMARLSDSITQSSLGSVEADRILRRARESSERANRRAQEKMQRAREKIDRKLAAAQRRAEEHERATGGSKESQDKRTWSSDWPPASSPAQSQTDASDEERLMILRMLEQKKISLAEAEQLLEALEGDSG